ncbi:hypothetical protein [Streptomyces viridosporus]|uniref:hypothetical protein n=1 Tax=Streptomyces viridosporus TaxID=67581 RepID=UPI002100311B|nr:hypothetical protein [Streptomyces viridosporus]
MASSRLPTASPPRPCSPAPNRGYARFLAQHTEGQNDRADGSEDPAVTAGHPRETAPTARPVMHTSTHTVLYDPDGLIEAELPLDRELYENLVKRAFNVAELLLMS